MSQSMIDLILRTKKQGNAAKETEKDLQKLNKTSADLLKEFTGLTLGVGALAAGMKWIVGEAGEAEIATARLNAVLKATGGVAGLTADELNNMATSLSNMSGVDDEAIVNAEAVLLTYTKLGKQAFPQAMRAAMDLSAVLGTDLQSAVQMLGKALDNPAEGLTALTRAAGKFTEEEEKMIQGLVDVGKLEEAQTVILEKLEGKYGGAAEAMGNTMVGSTNRLKNALNNLAESIGTKVAPAITWIAENAATALDVSAEVEKSNTAWDNFFQTMITEGKSASEITAAYSKKVKELNELFYGIQPTAWDAWTVAWLKLTTEEEKYLTNQEGLRAAQMASAKSAEEYAMTIIGVTHAEQLRILITDQEKAKLYEMALAQYNLTHATKEHVAGVYDAKKALEARNNAYSKSLEAMSQEERQLITEATYTDQARVASYNYAQQMQQAALDQAAFSQAVEDTSLNMDAVQFAIAGAVEGAWADYGDTLSGLKTEHDELTAQLEQLIAWGYSPLGKKIGEVNEALAINEAKQLDAAAAVEEATRKMIFQQAAAGLDAAATLELAKAMGMISDEDYAIAQTLQNLRDAFDDGKISAEQYASEVAAIAAAVASLHDKDIIVTVTTIRTEVAGEPVRSPKPETYQTGGQWTVAGPSGLDSVPVSFWATAGETVTVTPAGAAPPGAGGGYVFAEGAIVINAGPGMDASQLAEEVARRIAQETRRKQKAGEAFLGNG